MKWRAWHVVVAAGVVTAIAFIAFADRFMPGRRGELTLRPDDKAVTALGQRIYALHCASCHGAKLQGQPDWRRRDAQDRLPAPPHDASGHTWHHPDDLLFRITKFGVAKAANLKDYASAMPAYEGTLSDDEIVAVLSWIKAQWPRDIRALHDQMNQQQARPAP
jgi:S-disulfanyl-L-cysteine oxidoreductase SoxD